MTLPWLFGFVIFYTVHSQQGTPNHLSGTVVSETGTPIDGVKIFAWHDVTTDAEGKFVLPNPPKERSVVFFQKEGFRPKTLVVKAGTSTLNAVLEDDTKTAWLMSACLLANAKTSPKGAALQFLLPKNAKVKRVKDIDYEEYFVSVANSPKPLQLWYGPLVSQGRLVDELILGSANFEERSIHDEFGQIIGYDQRGKTQDGMIWRAADFAGFSASVIYEGISEEEATRYDRIIDSACHMAQSH